MPDYYNYQRVVQISGVTETTLVELQQHGFLEPTVKAGKLFLSSHQMYRLPLALNKARTDKINLLEAFKKLEERWIAPDTSLRN
jgi:hypothetical protein